MMQKRFIISLAISAAIIFLLFSQVNLSNVASVILSANLVFILLGLLAVLGSMFLKFLRWKMLVSSDYKVTNYDLASSLFASLFVGNVTPARSGDLTRSYFLKKKYKSSFMEMASLVIIERVVDIFILVLLSAVFFIAYAQYFNSTINILLLAISFAIFIFSIILVRKSFAEKMLTISFRIFKPIKIVSKIEPKVKEMLSKFYSGVGKLGRKHIAIVFLLTLMIWIAEAFLFFVSSLALGIDVPFVLCIGFIAISLVIGVVSSLPGGLGSMELVLFGFLTIYGLKETPALSLIILYRFFYFLGVFLCAPFFIMEARK